MASSPSSAPATHHPPDDLSLFQEEDGLKLLRHMSLCGDLQDSTIRSVAWRVFLGILAGKPDSWGAQCKAHREQYERLKKKYIINPHEIEETFKSDLSLNNPLSQEESSPWNQFFQNREVEKEIVHDVVRTYPGLPFFEQRWVRDMLTRILFVYARENSGVLYIQGMNEILAPILYVMDQNKIVPNLVDHGRFGITPYQSTLDAAYIEHDAYATFSGLLAIVGRWFSLHRREPAAGAAQVDESVTLALADENANNQIVNHCRYIHYTLLSAVDAHLSLYLKDLAIDPHLYMLRWVRILLAQVFALPDLLVLWDGIFAWGRQVELLDWLCVAMLATIRHLLLGKDYSACLQLLFHYPPVSDPRILLTTALHMMTKYNKSKSKERSVPKPLGGGAEPSYTSANIHAMLGSTRALLQPLTASLSTLKHMFVVDDPEEEVARLRTTQLHMANRIDRIVYMLQNSPTDESLRTAIDELCQIKMSLANTAYGDAPGPTHQPPRPTHTTPTISPALVRKR